MKIFNSKILVNQIFYRIKDNNGSALVLTMLILAVLTIVGISSISTTSTELKIVYNEKVYQRNFYLAESASYEGAQRLEVETDPDELIPSRTNLDWLNGGTVDYTIATNWVDDGSVNDNSDSATVAASAAFASVGHGVLKGSSLDIGTSRLYSYSMYGLAVSGNGKVLIEMGYKKRF